ESTDRCCATTIGWCTASGSPSSRRLTAPSPPQDVPIAMMSYTSRGLPVDALFPVQLLVAVGEAREVDRLLVAERQDAEGVEALEEELVDAILQRLVEVDHHVAAEAHVGLVEPPVRREVVLREDDVLGERAREASAVVRGEVVTGEVGFAAA